jgi:AraC-like DNA-binding protein
MKGPDATQAGLKGTLHLWPNGALFVAADMTNEPHRHFTSSILVGLSGPIRVRCESKEWALLDGVMVAPNVEQQLDATGERLAVFQVDPESNEYARIAHRFSAGPVHRLPEDIVQKIRQRLRTSGESSKTAFDAWTDTLDELASGGAPRRPIDPRIIRALAAIKEDFLAPPPAAELAAGVGLSPGRLIHLFTQEMGLPVRRYILWLRLRDVLFTLVAGKSLTEAAHQAGFSDSPHLSRTFRGMFGFPPSAIADARGGVRISYDAGVSKSQASAHVRLDEERIARSEQPRARGDSHVSRRQP